MQSLPTINYYIIFYIIKSMQEANIPVCPRCSMQFPPTINLHDFLNHVKACQSPPNQHPQGKNQNKQQYYYEKVPIVMNDNTKFRWQKKIKVPIDASKLIHFSPQDLIGKGLTFQEKQLWFRHNIQKNRIKWTEGADFMNIDKENLLVDSLNATKNTNMLREVKINFKGQKVNDAGGLLRQWTYMVIKEIFSINTGIFSIANTEDIMYKLKWDEETDEYFSKEVLCLFGITLAKAIFQKIPINSYIDRTIIRQISGHQVKFQDIYGYDEQLYRNWKYLLDNPDAHLLEQYFIFLSHSGETIKEIQILPDGKETLVNDQNKNLFVQLCMQMLTHNKVHRSINAIRQGIERVFPCQLLSIFEPYQIEMLMYGVPFIDIQDWFDNTEYKQPYSKNHKVIKWFWSVMETFDQEQLGRILHFCTGSSRTPIHGFSRLESNRGNYSKFLIVTANYDKKNPYPKGHTCFNRLELPMYPNQQVLSKYLHSISKNQLDGIFGLD